MIFFLYLARWPIQRLANRVTAALGCPPALAVITGVVIAWMVGNYAARLFGSTALEESPFPDLALVVTIAALVVALLILTTQSPKRSWRTSRRD